MPRIVRCLPHNDVPYQDPNNQVSRWARDSYWKFCNLKSLADWFWFVPTADFVRLPYAFIAHFIQQMYETVQFMRLGGPTPFTITTYT